MVKLLKRLLAVLIVMVLLLGGAVWWLLSYMAPDEQLDLRYAPMDVKAKALDMVKKLKAELVLSEADINDLIKKHLNSEYASRGAGGSSLELAKDLRLDGAVFELEDDKLIARMNVTYKDRIPAELDAVYLLEWQPPNIALRPQSLSVKEMALPVGLLETVIIPLDLPAQDVLSVRDVLFEKNQLRIRFKLQIQLPL
ncbi:hypothetical protein [Paenibacillus sp. Soil522]|uniref:hypothetical protein n=1 Tax=Paenibacillus sp. Soil522 TaxID=1736388 RepID=UPI0006F6E036|nr:hypothetical protein [Paenibacillus sp. Soil522]KRE46776.1 hypothetical protein ASG81_10955 [Paenibacillus sp. Soil522]